MRFLGQPDWGSHTYPLAGMDPSAATIQLGAGGWQFADIAAVGMAEGESVIKCQYPSDRAQ